MLKGTFRHPIPGLRHMFLLADSPSPVIDAGWAILFVSRVLHTVSAAILLGGLVYLKHLVAPLAAGATDPAEALYRGRRAKWAVLVMASTLFLLLSGFFNLWNYMVGYEKLPSTYHMLFGIKFLLAMFVFFVAAGTAGKSPMAVKMQREIQRWLNLAVGAAVLVFALGAVMRTYEKVPRDFNAPENAPVVEEGITEEVVEGAPIESAE
jgi:uncharacterized membrane protein